MQTKVENTENLGTFQLVHLLDEMWKIRIFEETLHELYGAGKVYGTLHLCIGQEATAVGACAALRKTDLITSTHRNHGHSIAKGTDMRAMFAEMLGKITGTNKGKGGSMHIADPSVGNLGSNGIVGAGFPIAAGAALTAQMNQTNQVVLCFAGDGATNEGSFHEALNLASIWRLPVVYFIENNQYAMSSPVGDMVNVAHISDRAAAYNIPGVTIDGNDVLAVKCAVEEAVTRARKGEGPTLIEALTYRHMGHSKSDKLLYRSEEECERWKQENDPISRFEKELIERGVTNKDEIQAKVEEIREEVAHLAQLALEDEEPSLEELYKDVYCGSVGEMN
ncbi:MAG: thiamine pyrophosphate-dependent dehydrogenase E1 component subunit alpha [Lactobacillales bacterium]|nr:thiamine pyrophosphate-dependent dehydrogenase E1 component subunit alpha [Lactobacillales bacterium]